MQSYVSSSMPTYITNWLNTNVNPVGSAVVVDKTLSIEGAAGDAKIIGDTTSRGRSSVSNGTDWNTINKNGFYAITSNLNNFINYPPQANRQGLLIVCTAQNNVIFQYYNEAMENLYYRRYWGDNWSDWKKINDNVQSMTGYDGKNFDNIIDGINQQIKETVRNTLKAFPWNDFNAAIDTGFYTIPRALSGITNTPINAPNSGFIIIMNNIEQKAIYQILFCNNQTIWVRFKWGDTNWYNWYQANSPDLSTVFRGIKVNPSLSQLNDCNEVINNSLYSLTNHADIPQVANLPVQQGGSLFTFSASSASSASVKIQLYFTSTAALYMRSYWAEWRDWQKVLDIRDYDTTDFVHKEDIMHPSIAMFEKIGIIGDSYASGQIYLSGSPINYYNRSWGQIIGRKNGINVQNFSRGGLDTRSWLTDSKGLPLLLSSNKKGLYIIVLGINDNALGKEYIGTESDFDLSNFSNTPDTFYGNMCKIIGNCLQKSPGSKIILSTQARNNGTVIPFINEAIENITQLANIGLIKQYEHPYFQSNYYKNGMVGGHPTVPNYAGMATAIQDLIETEIFNNYNYFMDFTWENE